MKNTKIDCLNGEIIDYSPLFKSKTAQIDRDGNVIKIWKSPSYAAKTLNYDSSMISKCANGIIKSYKSFVWRYIENRNPIVISKDKQKEIIEYYKNTAISINKLSEHFGVGISAIKIIIKNIEKYDKKCNNGNTKIPYSEYENIKNMYLKYYTVKDIAQKYKVTPSTIRKILTSCNIPLRTLKENIFFNKQNEIIEYYHKTKSVKKCIERFKTQRFSRFIILESLSGILTISDELIITIFYSCGKLNSIITNHYFRNNKLTKFEHKIVDYINNRFPDSESTKETLFRIYYKRYDKPLCVECGKNTVNFTSNKHVFTKFCSKKCSRNNKDTISNYHKTLKDTYGNEFYNNKEQNIKTCEKRYGKTNVFATDWCKEKIKKFWKTKYGVENPNQVEEIKNKHNFKELSKKGIETKRKNKTFNTSKPEEECYKLLCVKFGNEDIERQYNKDSRYPFQCDFYVKSLDMFIEYNGHWTHGKHPYNDKDENDIKTVQKWKERSTKNKFYEVAINVWTKYDVNKRNFARKSNIKYVELWNMNDVKNFIEQKV